MGHFQAVHEKWQSKGVAVLMINVAQDADTVRDFVRENGFTFPAFADTGYDAAGKYRVRYTPTTVFIDKNGNLRKSMVGGFDSEAAIEKQFTGFIK